MKGPLIYYNIHEMYGTDLSSIKLASELRASILEDIELDFNVEVDFKNVRSISGGWARNAFGIIIRDNNEQFFKQHIKIINTSKKVRKTILEGIGEVLT